VKAYDLIHQLYIFDYGSLLAILHFREHGVKIRMIFNEDEMIEGMAIIAGLIRKFHSRKLFIADKFVGYMGREYILVASIKNKSFAPFLLGLLRRITVKLDNIGILPVDTVVQITLRELRTNLDLS